MKKILLETFIGIVLCGFGIYVGYLYITGINNGSNPVLLVLSIILIGVGVFSLYKASTYDDTIIQKPTVDTTAQTPATTSKILERNNQLTSQWKKTIEQRDKLKMLQIAGGIDNPE